MKSTNMRLEVKQHAKQRRHSVTLRSLEGLHVYRVSALLSTALAAALQGS